MSYDSAAAFLPLWLLAFHSFSVEPFQLGSFVQDAYTRLSKAADSVEGKIKKIPLLKRALSHCVEPPFTCPNENVTFWYYTRDSDEPLQLLVSDPETLDIPPNEKPWKMIIHGYTKSKDAIPNPQLRPAYFAHGDYNLISIDYHPLAERMCYVEAVKNVPLVAKCTAQLIDALIDRDLFQSHDLHVIGFSLGAQIAGQLYQYMEHEKPGRVTGLDPAGPLFDGVFNHKLTEDAAEFVDVIHTNAFFNGKMERSGHVDFYANGGLNQPGCILPACSHNKAPSYFAESINSPTGFWGIPCTGYFETFIKNCDLEDPDDLVLMGEFVPHTARGIYLVLTNKNPPFSKGKKRED